MNAYIWSSSRLSKLSPRAYGACTRGIEEGGRAYGDHGDDDEQDDNWHRHASIVYAIAQKDEFDMKNSAFPHVISKK